ncbi:MAG: peptide deformylase [candidate division FCPU426 bacterium]
MAILPICTWGHPVLKTRAKEIKQVDDRIRQLARDMLETMRAENGLGLAANQVGVAERLFVVEVPAKVGPPVTHIIINPKITFRSKEKETLDEGCLSFPQLWGPVERALEVEIEGVDLEGKQVLIRGAGMVGRAFQHELDHLDGIVFIERMNLVHRVRLNKQLREIARATRNALAGRKAAKL